MNNRLKFAESFRTSVAIRKETELCTLDEIEKADRRLAAWQVRTQRTLVSA